MNKIGRFAAIFGLAVVLAVNLGGCGSTNPFGSDGIPSGNIPNGQGTVQSIERVGSGDTFRFAIRMNSGQVHTLRHDGRAGFRVGDRVRIRDGTMEKL